MVYNLNESKENKFFLIQTYFNTISDDHKNKLIKSKNAILYPSIAIRTKETMRKQQEILLENIKAFMNGKPKNIIS